MKAHFDGQLEFWNKHVIVNVEKQLKGVVEMKAKLELDGHNEGAQAYPSKVMGWCKGIFYIVHLIGRWTKIYIKAILLNQLRVNVRCSCNF